MVGEDPLLLAFVLVPGILEQLLDSFGDHLLETAEDLVDLPNGGERGLLEHIPLHSVDAVDSLRLDVEPLDPVEASQGQPIDSLLVDCGGSVDDCVADNFE